MVRLDGGARSANRFWKSADTREGQGSSSGSFLESSRCRKVPPGKATSCPSSVRMPRSCGTVARYPSISASQKKETRTRRRDMHTMITAVPAFTARSRLLSDERGILREAEMIMRPDGSARDEAEATVRRAGTKRRKSDPHHR